MIILIITITRGLLHGFVKIDTWISELSSSSSQSQVEEKVRGVPGSITKEIPLKILSFILFAHNREKRRGGIIIKFFSQLEEEGLE